MQTWKWPSAVPGVRALVVLALAGLTAACILSPGKFVSQLDVRKDRTFSFAYQGEILMLPLMQTAKDEPFSPSACQDEESQDDRDCTPDEIAEQKRVWDSEQQEKRLRDAQAAQMLLGGIDPSNPDAGRELAGKLARQQGWRKVEYLGNGKFAVDFAISGTLDHDFAFPTMEGFAMSNAFVQVSLRSDGTVRVDAPGFGPPGGAAAMAGMVPGLADGASDGRALPAMADGRFTIVSDASILANNTDEGPTAAATGKTLAWAVNPRSKAAPMALLRLMH